MVQNGAWPSALHAAMKSLTNRVFAEQLYSIALVYRSGVKLVLPCCRIRFSLRPLSMFVAVAATPGPVSYGATSWKDTNSWRPGCDAQLCAPNFADINFRIAPSTGSVTSLNDHLLTFFADLTIRS
jgi:hypothetical protein